MATIAIFAPLLLLDSEHPPVLALLDLEVLVSLSSNLLPPSKSMMPGLHPLPPSSLQVEHGVLVAPGGGQALLGRGGGEGDTLAGGGGGGQGGGQGQGQGGGGGPSPALNQQLLLLVLRVDVNHSTTLLECKKR